MIYAFIAAILIGFGAGFGVSHQLDQAEIIALESAIKSANDQAAMALKQARKEADRVKADQQNIAQQLDKSHEQNIQTINALRDQLSAVRLQPSSSAHGRSAKSEHHDPRIAEEEAEYEQLPESLDQLVKAEFYRADTVAEYAEACYTFVVEQNCGVPLPDPVDKLEPEISGESITDDSWFD